MIKNLRPPSTQSFMARTIAFKEATTSEKLVPVSNNSLLKNPANNKTEPMPEHGLRPLRRVGDIYGNYIVKTELKAVPVSNRTLLQAKTSNPITGTFIMRKSEPMPVPSGISKEYRKLLNLNILPAGYALNKGPKKVELAFLEKLTNDNAKKIVLEFMTNSVAGSIYKPLRIIHGGPKNVEQNAQAKEAYDSAIQEMTEMFQKGQTQGTSVQLVIDRFMGDLRRIYNTPAFNIDDYVNSKDVEEGIERLKRESFKAQQVFGGDREDANGQATQEQMLAVLQNLLNAQQAGVLPDQAAAADVAQAQNQVPIKIDEAAAVGGISPEQEKKQADDLEALQKPPDVPQAPLEEKDKPDDDKTIRDAVENRLRTYASEEELKERLKKLKGVNLSALQKRQEPLRQAEINYEIARIEALLEPLEQPINPASADAPPLPEADVPKASTPFNPPTPDEATRKIVELDKQIAKTKDKNRLELLNNQRAQLQTVVAPRIAFDPKIPDYKLPTAEDLRTDSPAVLSKSLERVSAAKIELDKMTEKDIFFNFPYANPTEGYVHALKAYTDSEASLIKKLGDDDPNYGYQSFYVTEVLPKLIENKAYSNNQIKEIVKDSLIFNRNLLSNDIIDKIIREVKSRQFSNKDEYLNDPERKKAIITALKQLNKLGPVAATAAPVGPKTTASQRAAQAESELAAASREVKKAKAEKEVGAKIVEAKLASEKAEREALSAKIREEESKLPFSATNINKNVAYLLDPETGNFNTITNFTDVRNNYAENKKLNFPLYNDLIEAHQTALNSNDLPKKTNAIKEILLQIEKDWYFANPNSPNLSKMKTKVFPKIDDKGKNAFINYWTAYEKYKEYSKAQNAYGVEPSEEMKKKTKRIGSGRKSRKSKKEPLPKLAVTDEEYKKSTKKLLKREKGKRSFQEILDEPKIKRGATRFSTDELNQIIQSILSTPL